MRGILVGAFIGVVCTAQLVACSSDEKKKAADAGPDSNNADGNATGGTGGSAGSDASAGASGTGGSAGVAGTGGSAGADASAGAAGTGGSAGADAGLVCSPMVDLDAGVAGAAGMDGGMDGGAGAAGATDAAVPNGYKWHDWANNVCGDCVGRTLLCGDFEGGSSFDPATGILTLQLNPGVAEVVDAMIIGEYWYTNDVDAAVGAGSLSAPMSMQVDKNTISIDLSAEIPNYASHVGSIEIRLRDACGVTSDISWFATFDPDGGTVFPIYCEF